MKQLTPRFSAVAGLVAFVLVASSSAPAVRGAPVPVPAADGDKDAFADFGFASRETTADDPMRIVITELDAATKKLVERNIEVTDIPRYVRPTINFGETPRQFGQRLIKAQEDHSKLKAEKIAAAINGVLGMGRATVEQSNTLANSGLLAWNFVIPGDMGFTQIRNGKVTVTGAHKMVYGPTEADIKARNAEIKAAVEFNRKNPNNKIDVPKPLKNNNTGEVGDTVKIKNKPGTPPSPGGSKGGMSSMNYELDRQYPGEFPGIPMRATGVDDDGNPSTFVFGIIGRYVAELRPALGQSDENVFREFEGLLDAHGLPATYDSLTRTLTLDGEFGDDDTFLWGTNDTGFAQYLTAGYGVVPEPASLLLLLLAYLGAALLGLDRRRRRE